MDLRLKFNEDAANYDKYRPVYVTGLFDDILAYSGVDNSCKALEIGIGTGQATLPFLKTGCMVTAVELGEKLAEFSRRKFASYRNLQVINVDFETFDGGNDPYDLVFSATAFHWIPQEIGYPKVYGLLKRRGTVALFWNHPSRPDDSLHREIGRIYKKHKPSDEIPAGFDEKSCQKRIDILLEYGFTDAVYKIYHQTRPLTAEAYISLLNTYSDHRALPNATKIGLERDIADAINDFGGVLDIYDTMDLYLARKP